jgi:hypothetical protein
MTPIAADAAVRQLPGSGTAWITAIRSMPLGVNGLFANATWVPPAFVHAVFADPRTVNRSNSPRVVGDEADTVSWIKLAPGAIGTCVPAATLSKSLANNVVCGALFVTVIPDPKEPGNT